MKLALPALGILALVLSPYIVYCAARAGIQEYHENFCPTRHIPIVLPAAYQELGLKVVNLAPPQESPFMAYYKAPKQGGVVILVHGSEGDRNQLLPEAKILIDQGLGVLSVDLPGHGESGGKTSWGDPQQKALRSALDWLDSQRNGTHWSYGIFGFSMGAMSALQTAALDQRLGSVALAGAFASYQDVIKHSCGRKSWLVMLPMMAVNYFNGFKYWTFRPIDLVANLTHATLLLIAGGKDTVIPLNMTQELYNAAPGPKQLVLLSNSSHGTYLKDDGELYESTIRDYFGKNLTPPELQSSLTH